jgi:hypothetical protein
MIDHIVVGVEIQKTIEETPGGWDATDLLGVAVACVWEYSTARMRVYGPEDVEALRNRLLRADRISGFNIFNLDFPVIWGINREDWNNNNPSVMPRGDGYFRGKLFVKCDDILRRIWQAKKLDPDKFRPATHGGVGLDAIAATTIQARRIGHGGDAPKWFQAGLIQKVVNYCADDVAIERDLTDFVDRYGYVVLPDGKRLLIPQWRGA